MPSILFPWMSCELNPIIINTLVTTHSRTACNPFAPKDYPRSSPPKRPTGSARKAKEGKGKERRGVITEGVTERHSFGREREREREQTLLWSFLDGSEPINRTPQDHINIGLHVNCNVIMSDFLMLTPESRVLTE